MRARYIHLWETKVMGKQDKLHKKKKKATFKLLILTIVINV